jgi:phosphatidate cytidylyltransferase
MLYLNFNFINSFIASILYFYGDLFFSLIKRRLLIKDFSNILKHHGGIIDRLDSMSLVTCYFFIYITFV